MLRFRQRFLLRRLRARVRDDAGMALVMTLGLMLFLSISVTTTVYVTSTSGRTAENGEARQLAFGLAEAGINNAMAVLSLPSNNALNPYLLPQRTSSYEGGTVTWSGVLDQGSAVWTLTSIGRVRNPTGPGADEAKRTLTAKVPVVPTISQPLNNPSWNYVMSTQVTGGECDMTVGNTVNVGTRLYVMGNLCLVNSGWVSKGPLAVQGKVTMYNDGTKIGDASAPATEVHVDDGCKWKSNALHDPCRYGAGSAGNDNIWATTITSNPQTLTAPNADLDSWYLNASPGPYYPCYTQSGTPPTFDAPVHPSPGSATNAELLAYRNNNNPLVDLAPPTRSYSCVTAGGELSWNHTTRILTVKGTIYFDGDVKIQNTSGPIQYNGQATIYVSGSLLIKTTKLCGGISGSDCAFSTWDPNGKMLTFVANGANRQLDVPAGVSIELMSSQFQGALYATNKLRLDTSSKSDGPMVGSEVVLGQSIVTDDFPTITNVPVGMPGNPAVYAQPNSPEKFSS